jgi:hypothetical protein
MPGPRTECADPVMIHSLVDELVAGADRILAESADAIGKVSCWLGCHEALWPVPTRNVGWAARRGTRSSDVGSGH